MFFRATSFCFDSTINVKLVTKINEGGGIFLIYIWKEQNIL